MLNLPAPSWKSLLAALVTAAALMPLGCGGDDSPTRAEVATDRDFNRDLFSNPTKVDNEWYPLVAGTEFIYEGRSNRGQGRRAHRVITTVTDLTKVIDGVRTRVLWDQDINAGKLLEGELAFQAQDDDGNVWNFGEYPEEYDDQGKFEGAPDTWLSGVQGARAGILMRGDPRTGTPAYRQGWAPKIEFGDRARVYKMGQKDCVPVGCYEHVLVTDETNPFEPADGHQLKYNASDVGTIRAAPRGGKEKEVLVLVDVKRLSSAELAKVRREALKLDRRAYRSRGDVFGRTAPVRRGP
jgi:hypothetical protein